MRVRLSMRAPKGELLLAIVLGSIFASCTSVSLRGERVRVTKHEADVRDCKLLGEVVSTPPWVGPNDAENDLRNRAADLGADVVLTHMGVGRATAKAYDCGGRYAKASGRD